MALLHPCRRHKPGELEAAEIRVNIPKGHDIFHEFEPILSTHGGPPVLFFGASHIRHLKDYIFDLPLGCIEKMAYNRSRYISVGGSTWKEIVDHVRGIGLSDMNKHLGNQWVNYINSTHEASYIVIALGSNDVDSFARTLALVFHFD